ARDSDLLVFKLQLLKVLARRINLAVETAAQALIVHGFGLELNPQEIAWEIGEILNFMHLCEPSKESKAAGFGRRSSDRAILQANVLEDNRAAIVQVNISRPGLRVPMRRKLFV